MKKIYKNGTIILTVMGIVFNLSSVEVLASPVNPRYAGSIHKTSAGETFDKSWQSTAYSGDATLKYGYNTNLINEDYSWAYHTKKDHSAEVGNDRGVFGTAKKSPGSTAKIEVTHSGTSIKYQNTWY